MTILDAPDIRYSRMANYSIQIYLGIRTNDTIIL